jgi:hypothetical protein
MIHISKTYVAPERKGTDVFEKIFLYTQKSKELL